MRRLGPALAVRDFRLWFCATFGMTCALAMLEVIIGWSVYSHQRSALDLGWIGLAEFIPLLALALPAGHLADRHSRKRVLAAANLLGVGVGIGLALITAAGVHAAAPYLGFAVGAGVTMAIGQTAGRAMPPTLVGRELIPSAMTLRSFASQGAQIIGPALGGLIYGLSPPAVYALAAASSALAAVAAAAIGPGVTPTDRAPAPTPTVRSVLDGLHFIARTQILLGAILLDLFAVLFGGAVALLPIFARILHVGSSGLGILRAAPALGALLGAAYLTRRPVLRRAGRLLLAVVAAFGGCMILFGLSHSFALSLIALLVSGFVDLVSVNIRTTTSALVTPDPLRGRVGAVELIFLSASNQLGAFESGLAASLVGALPAVVGGGCLTILLALVWVRLFPSLRRVDRMTDIQPAELPAQALG